MKIKTVIEIFTESLEEEQFILNRFPQAWWINKPPGFKNLDGHTVFYLGSEYTNEVTEAISEWNEMNKKEK